MRTHIDRYPEAIHIIRDVWEQYGRDPWRTFGPVNSMIKAAELIKLTPKANMEFKTFEDFSFAPITAVIQKVLLLVKRHTLWKATQHKTSDMIELPSINLDYRTHKQLEHMNPLRRAAVDQTLFGAVTTQSELAKQHKVSPACTPCGDLPPRQKPLNTGTGTVQNGPPSEGITPSSWPPHPS